MRLVPSLLALLAVALIVFAVAQMTAGDFSTAGVSFLAASLVIYVRETWALE